MRDDEDEDMSPDEDWSDIDHPEGEKGKRPDPVYLLLNNEGGVVLDPALKDSLYEKSYFGKIDEGTNLLFLFPEEILVFSERNRLLAIKGQSIEEATKILGEIKEKWENGGIDAFAGDTRFLSSEALFKHFQETVPDFWEKYVVYRDLKTRGYIVRRGIKDISHFRVYKKGVKKGNEPAKFIYFGIFEGKPVPLVKLHEISDYAMNNRQELILAVVDRQMDITYYNVKKQEI
nr:tRNA-intron lyase [Candidatus Sigynarchaeota archaeon]